MPTAATHLVTACKLLEGRLLTASEAQAAFLLGAISPDVKAISGASRETTHFYTIPPNDGSSAVSAMMAAHPTLARASLLAPTHASFIGGYLSHLIMDEVWLHDIVMPHIYVDGALWGKFHPRFRLYGYLMVYLERRSLERLGEETLRLLPQAEPNGWLPFVCDRFLHTWRDQVAEQITLGGAALVTHYFAGMIGMETEELAAITSSEERMMAEVYSIVPRARIEDFWRRVQERSQKMIGAYLAGKSLEQYS